MTLWPARYHDYNKTVLTGIDWVSAELGKFQWLVLKSVHLGGQGKYIFLRIELLNFQLHSLQMKQCEILNKIQFFICNNLH